MRYKTMSQFIEGRLLGSGSFGQVVEVHDADNGQHFAVKKVQIGRFLDRKNNQQQSTVLEKIYQEAHLLMRLDHHNIVAVCSYFTEANSFHIVMEYCSGGTLRTAIEKKQMTTPRTYFTEARIILWSAQILQALTYLHGLKIMHRDLKPENIMLVNHKKTIKLGDFGLARAFSQTLDGARTRVGTETHMAPELFDLNSELCYTFPADIWSAGVVLYEICSLELPFKIRCVLSQRLVIPGESPAGPELRNIILNKMLLFEPSERSKAHQLCAEPVFRATFCQLAEEAAERKLQRLQFEQANEGKGFMSALNASLRGRIMALEEQLRRHGLLEALDNAENIFRPRAEDETPVPSGSGLQVPPPLPPTYHFSTQAVTMPSPGISKKLSENSIRPKSTPLLARCMKGPKRLGPDEYYTLSPTFLDNLPLDSPQLPKNCIYYPSGTSAFVRAILNIGPLSQVGRKPQPPPSNPQNLFNIGPSFWGTPNTTPEINQDEEDLIVIIHQNGDIYVLNPENWTTGFMWRSHLIALTFCTVLNSTEPLPIGKPSLHHAAYHSATDSLYVSAGSRGIYHVSGLKSRISARSQSDVAMRQVVTDREREFGALAVAEECDLLVACDDKFRGAHNDIKIWHVMTKREIETLANPDPEHQRLRILAVISCHPVVPECVAVFSCNIFANLPAQRDGESRLVLAVGNRAHENSKSQPQLMFYELELGYPTGAPHPFPSRPSSCKTHPLLTSSAKPLVRMSRNIPQSERLGLVRELYFNPSTRQLLVADEQADKRLLWLFDVKLKANPNFSYLLDLPSINLKIVAQSVSNNLLKFDARRLAMTTAAKPNNGGDSSACPQRRSVILYANDMDKWVALLFN